MNDEQDMAQEIDPLLKRHQEEIRGPLREYGIHIKKWGVTKALVIVLLVGSFIEPQIIPYLLAAIIISAVRTW
jgi:hypothetical protein